MLQFHPLKDREDRVATIALDWCRSYTQTLTGEQQLEWAKVRVNRRELIKADKPNNLFQQVFAHKLGIEDWGRLVADISLLCARFYTENAGEVDPETAERIKAEAEAIALQFPKPTEEQKLAKKRFAEKMNAESTFMKARLKDNPDLSPDKIQLELSDGVAYISKKSGWVLSQF